MTIAATGKFRAARFTFATLMVAMLGTGCAGEVSSVEEDGAIPSEEGYLPPAAEGVEVTGYDPNVDEIADGTGIPPEFVSAEEAEAFVPPSLEEADVDAIDQELVSGDSAVHWMGARKGSRAYEGLCLKAVRSAYRQASAGWATASALYAYMRKGGQIRPPPTPAPRGALLWYSLTGTGSHVALADGAGGIWSTSVGGAINYARFPHFRNYLGWSYPPGEWK